MKLAVIWSFVLATLVLAQPENGGFLREQRNDGKNPPHPHSRRINEDTSSLFEEDARA
jgi:hypothetical protein